MLFKRDIVTNNEATMNMIISLLDTVAISPLVSIPLLQTTFSFDAENASEVTQATPTTLSSLFSETFSLLDGDRDGYLTSSDFSSQGT